MNDRQNKSILLDDSPETVDEFWFVVGVMLGPFKGRLLDQKSQQLVSNEGDRIRLDDVHQMAQVGPRSLDVDKVYQAL